MSSNPLDNFNIAKFNFLSNPLKMFLPKKMVGIDVGTASIKIVELSRWGQGKTLENYGEVKSEALYKGSFRDSARGSYLLSNYFVARAIRAILDEARIRTKDVMFSIPDFSTFCTSIDLPPMSKEELGEAVYYTAPQYIPLPIGETTLDWKVIGGVPGQKDSGIKVFLVAIPNQTIHDYQQVAKLAGLNLYAIEAEALSISRALVQDGRDCICIVDIGVQSTTVNIVDKQSVKKSFSFDFASSQLAHSISSALGVDILEAEKIKNTEGLISSKADIAKLFYLLVDPLLAEIRKVFADFLQEYGVEPSKVYLTGGTAALPGLKEYFVEALKKKTEIPNCFSDMLYPPILDKTVEDLAPRFSAAVGVALGGLDIN